jgi:hypothetical protein
MSITQTIPQMQSQNCLYFKAFCSMLSAIFLVFYATASNLSWKAEVEATLYSIWSLVGERAVSLPSLIWKQNCHYTNVTYGLCETYWFTV